MAAEVAKEGGKWGVLLLAHGAPDRLGDIPAFLLNVRDGRKLPDAVVNEIVRRYSLIGGSPLLRLTTLQAEGLAKLLGRPVYLGMRNWKPFISEAVRQIKADGVERVVALCLAPQNSRTSIGLYKKYLLKMSNGSHQMYRWISSRTGTIIQGWLRHSVREWPRHWPACSRRPAVRWFP